jgi:hypothetical protein
MSYNALNYTEQGGEKTVIGGTLEIKEGASVTGLATNPLLVATEETLGGVKAAAAGDIDTVEVKINTSTSKLYVPTYPVLPVAATTGTAGIVKMAANVAKIEGDTVTVDEFNDLIDALVAAGLMAADEE